MTNSLRIDARLGIAAVAVLVACTACRDVAAAAVAPELPSGAEAIAPPADYAAWWAATERCAGLTGDMSRISWFAMPGRTSFMYQDGQYDGYWWNRVHWILLAGDKVENGMIVRHEMLHDLLGRGDHPPEWFQQRCAGIVECNEVCRGEE